MRVSIGNQGRTCQSVVMKWLTRIALALAANGILFLIAAVVFDRFNLSFGGWLIGTLLFTVFTVLLRRIMSSLARKYASGATFVGGLALVWVALLLTDLFTSRGNFELEGLGTWIYTILIVWVGTVLYDQVDDRLLDAVSGKGTKHPA